MFNMGEIYTTALLITNEYYFVIMLEFEEACSKISKLLGCKCAEIY